MVKEKRGYPPVGAPFGAANTGLGDARWADLPLERDGIWIALAVFRHIGIGTLNRGAAGAYCQFTKGGSSLNRSQRARRRERRERCRREPSRRSLEAVPKTPEDVFSFENLNRAARVCAKGTLWKSAAMKFDRYRAVNCIRLRERLLSGKYRRQPPVRFTLCERGKVGISWGRATKIASSSVAYAMALSSLCCREALSTQTRRAKGQGYLLRTQALRAGHACCTGEIWPGRSGFPI